MLTPNKIIGRHRHSTDPPWIPWASFFNQGAGAISSTQPLVRWDLGTYRDLEKPRDLGTVARSQRCEALPFRFIHYFDRVHHPQLRVVEWFVKSSVCLKNKLLELERISHFCEFQSKS